MSASVRTAWWIRAYRIAFGLLGIALVWIPLRNMDSASFSLTNYLSYFTIESNILTVIVLLVGGTLARRARAGRRFAERSPCTCSSRWSSTRSCWPTST